MTDPVSFAAWLRRERERRNITIRAIAERTKIGPGLLEALERGDVSRWPGGIYRRAFVRSYSEAIGLDPELVIANFERVFPAADGEPAPVSAATVVSVPAASASRAAVAPPEFRLQLEVPVQPGVTSAAIRHACIDVGIALGAGLVGWLAAGAIGFWCVTAVTALVYHACGVLGVRSLRAIRPVTAQETIPAARPAAPPLRFPDEPARSASRRGRARRVMDDLSSAATFGASRRRRAVRS